ncbi:MAG: tonB-dependent Receptor Plug domain protein [Novosphingobium sp.]|nr:tonB-dependent Receptor Plug domain protein [Novosphingobium sp.]
MSIRISIASEHRNQARRASLLLGSAFLALAATTAHAAADDAAALAATASDAAAGEGEVIVVTGSRGEGRTAEKSLTPISVVSSADLERSGKQNLRDALAEIVPSYAVTAGGYLGQQGAAVRSARLKGLDTKHTLVLVNGKRRHTTALSISTEAPTDLDLIPANAVERIEVLSDGAAAQYGSDAIAGVINIILKTNASGGAATLGYGQYGSTVGDLSDRGYFGRTWTFQAQQGVGIGDGGFFNFGADVRLQNATNAYGSYPLSTPIYPKLPNGSADPRETSISRYRQWIGQPSANTYSFYYNTEVPLGDAATFYSNSTFAHRYSEGPGYFRPALSPQTNTTVYPDGYLPVFATNENDFQVVAGFKGDDLGGWSWDLSSTYGRDNAKVFTNNSINVSAGSAAADKHDFYDGSLINGQLVTGLDLSKKFDSGLFGRPLTVSLGLEHRYETYKIVAGEPLSYQLGNFVWPVGSPFAGQRPNPGAQGMGGFAPEVAGSWSRQNFAAYIELNQQLTDRWTANLAGRYEYYTDFGSAPSGQLSTRYEFSDHFAIRGTFGTGFSAPTLQQQHYSTRTGSYSTDPVTGVLSQRFTVQATTDSAIGQVLGVQPLKPENSINASIGFVAKPFDGVTVTLDGYLVDITNRIVTSPTLTNVYVQQLLTAAGIQNVNSVTFYMNGGHTRTKGLDLKVDYRHALGNAGNLRWTLAANYNATSLLSLNTVPPALAASTDNYQRALLSRFTTFYPKIVASLAVNWDWGRFNLNAKETYWGSTEFLSPNGSNLDQYNEPAFTTNLNVSYALTDNVKFEVGGTNIFGHRPNELSAAAQKFAAVPIADNAYNSYAPYGYDGGFYYARVNLKW